MPSAEIYDYALIGDCRSGALISRRGSIDFLCWPNFDSPALFAGLLDAEAGGYFSIAGPADAQVSRSYIEETAVLETTFASPTGTLVLTDLMPVTDEAQKDTLLLADHEIVRLVTCTRGEMPVEIRFAPRPAFATRPFRLQASRLGVRLESRPGVVFLRGETPLEVRGERAEARVTLRAGDSLAFSLSYTELGPAVLPPLGVTTRAAIDRTVHWWKQWAARTSYDGLERGSVVRSAITLKLLTFAPSGAIVASPTTSLPERIGGPLNWDYRFCWLRDAGFTVRAFLGLGYRDEAEAWVNWLLHSTRLTRPELRVLYTIYGERPPRERVLAHLSGFHDSRPVRIGNAARDQLQLDIYGEVIDATTHLIRAGAALDRPTVGMLRDFGRYVCEHWSEPDEGIWELRSGRYLHTHSRLLCWVALDRLLELHEKDHVPCPVEPFTKARALIRRDIEENAWNESVGAYVGRLGGDELDATVLLLPWYGFVPPDDPRMRKTYAAVLHSLGTRDGLLYRYRLDESAGEGTFAICSFWAIEYLARGGGTLAEARAGFAHLLTYANELGLYAEEIAPGGSAALGNFPQAYTHVGLINAALSIAERARGAIEHRPAIPARTERHEVRV